MRDKDLATEEGVRSVLAFETIATEGNLAQLWRMHFDDAMERVEGGRRIVFYLAAYEPARRRELIEFPKDPPPDNPDDVEDTRWLNRYILASGNDSFENPDHGRYPEGVLRAALECLNIGFEPDKIKWVTVSSRKKLVN